jgi:hypothetical protein
MLENSIGRVTISASSEYSFTVPTDDYIIASHNEFLRYAIRGIINFEDFCKEPNGISRAWRFVTLYYSLYFFTISIERLAGLSVIYLNLEECGRLSNIISTLSGTCCVLQRGDYQIKLHNRNEPLASRSEVIVELKKLNTSSHESTWILFSQIVLDWTTWMKGKSLTTAKGIHNCIKSKSTIFSERRNIVNYKGLYACHELDNEICFLKSSMKDETLEELEKKIMRITSLSNSDDSVMQSALKICSLYYKGVPRQAPWPIGVNQVGR